MWRRLQVWENAMLRAEVASLKLGMRQLQGELDELAAVTQLGGWPNHCVAQLLTEVAVVTATLSAEHADAMGLLEQQPRHARGGGASADGAGAADGRRGSGGALGRGKNRFKFLAQLVPSVMRSGSNSRATSLLSDIYNMNSRHRTERQRMVDELDPSRSDPAAAAARARAAYTEPSAKSGGGDSALSGAIKRPSLVRAFTRRISNPWGTPGDGGLGSARKPGGLFSSLNSPREVKI
jgi:hypothetical protein